MAETSEGLVGAAAADGLHPHTLIETPRRRPFPGALRASLALRFGSQFSTGPSVLGTHARGESPFHPQPPDGVVFAECVQDVVDAVRDCAKFGHPVIAFGAGSSLEGQLLAVYGGISLDLGRMNAVLSIEPDDLTATVQAGVTREQLNAALKSHGLFFPIDPGAHASLGGMAATRASGTNAVRYGSMRENVLGLSVVTADARVVRTGTRARKSAAGYDLTRLFVGSEGTLGIITEVTLRVYPLPDAVSAAVVTFPTADGAIRTVIQAIQLGVPIARSEYLCARSMRAINLSDKLQLREVPTLFLEFHGSAAALREQAEMLQSLAQENHGEGFEWAENPEDRTRLWKARHNAYYACKRVRAHCDVIATDTCVPISRLAESLLGAEKILQHASFPTMLFGHVGDGNFHALLIVDVGNPAEMAEAERLNAAIVGLALSMGGTCSGEHGIGLHKIGFLVQEAGADAVELMRRIKQTFDPLNILNPGKIFQPTTDPAAAVGVLP
jgi:D-lactate dehydrogenase (cytochrome)